MTSALPKTITTTKVTIITIKMTNMGPENTKLLWTLVVTLPKLYRLEWGSVSSSDMLLWAERCCPEILNRPALNLKPATGARRLDSAPDTPQIYHTLKTEHNVPENPRESAQRTTNYAFVSDAWSPNLANEITSPGDHRIVFCYHTLYIWCRDDLIVIFILFLWHNQLYAVMLQKVWFPSLIRELSEILRATRCPGIKGPPAANQNRLVTQTMYNES